jgi:tryptophanyl-tRNA synthetase
MNNKKVLVSGVQSSGRLHIGNYFGAIRQNVLLGNSGEYESYVFIADYHSMTSLTNKDERIQNTFDAACVYLACGLDPQKVVFFKQSDVPAHAELAWVLNNVSPMSMLMLSTSFKDKSVDVKDLNPEKIIFEKILEELSQKNYSLNDPNDLIEIKKLVDDDLKSNNAFLSAYELHKENNIKNKYININAGLFTYPVLMAADILIYNAEVVPVGRDQAQHLEMTREIAGKYNRTYGETFKMPQAYIKEDVQTVPGIDGTKMSKSKGNDIPLFGTPEEIKKKVMNIVTDSARPEDKKNPDENSIYKIHKLFLNESDDALLRSKFENGGYGYKEAKEACLESILAFTEPMRAKYEYYVSNPEIVWNMLKDGGMKAGEKADVIIKKVRKDSGLDR